MHNYLDYENYLSFKNGIEQLYLYWINSGADYDEIHNDLVGYFDKNKVPIITLNPNYYFDHLYPFYQLAKFRNLGICEVDVNLIGGHNCSDVRDTIPSNISRLRGSMIYILGLDEEFKSITISKISDKYFVEDGKHRLYGHLLLGKTTIKANVTEYDYDEFLSKAYIKNSFGRDLLFYGKELNGDLIDKEMKEYLVSQGVTYSIESAGNPDDKDRTTPKITNGKTVYEMLKRLMKI